MKTNLSNTVLFTILALLLLATTGQASEHGPLDALQERIKAAGSYEFSAAIQQTLIPRPLPVNIGASEERVDSQVTGQVVLPDYVHMTLRFEAGPALPPLTIEQDGTATYLIEGGERTLIKNPLGAALPGGDFLSYVYGAQGVRVKTDPEHPQFTVYTYEIDGEQFARYMRDLVQRQVAPAGTGSGSAVTLSPILRGLTGHGELWVDAEGLPRRQIIDIHIPQISERYDARSHIVVDFQTAAASLPARSLNTQRPPSPPARAGTGQSFYTAASFLILFFLFMWAAGRRRWAHVALTLLIGLIIVTTPFLRGVAHAHQLDAREAIPDLLEALGLRSDTELSQPSDASSSSPPAPAPQATAQKVRAALDGEGCGSGDPGSDSDVDGTNDFVEYCLGTDPYYYDSDRDLITDTLEIQGFTYAGQTWYSDPQHSDSNRDGLSDYLEWPAPVGAAAEWDPDGDQVPNLWDDDNDGDNIPDALDLDPFVATGYRDAFSLQTTRGAENYSGYQYVEFQIQPQDADHLRYTTTALDWPYDEEGNVQDLDNSTDDLSLTPILKITTDNPPSSDLQEAHGLSVFKESADEYVMYVVLSPLSDGGRIVAFEGRVTYGPTELVPDELDDVTWSDMQLVWIANMAHDEQNGDEIDTETIPVAEYAESFRIAGLEITKSDETGYAILGTPNSPEDNRDLYQVVFGLEASFLSAVSPDLDEIVTRFGSDTTPITRTWGIPAADVAVSAPTAPLAHFDLLSGSAAGTISAFLDDNGYPTTSTDTTMASLAIAVETRMGVASLADLGDATGGSFTFNLANIPVNTTRSLSLLHYRHDGSNWNSLDDQEVLEVLYARYGDDLSAILAALQATYPDLDKTDLYALLFGFALIWRTSTPSQVIAVDGVTLVEETVPDSEIMAQLDLDGLADLPTYLIEAQDLALAGSGVVWDDTTSYYDYVRSGLVFDNSIIAGTVSSVLVNLNYLSQTLKAGTGNVFMAGVIIYSQGFKKLGGKLIVGARMGSYTNKSLRVSVGVFMNKYAVKLAYAIKILGVISSIGLLGYEIYGIWSTWAKYSSPYGYEESFATAYAITATVVAVVFFLLSFNAIGLAFVVAFALAALIVGWISDALGGHFDFASELISAIASIFVSYETYTEVSDIDFAGLKADVDGSLVDGSTLTLSDKFTGRIKRVRGNDGSQLNRSEMYAWFQADAHDSSTIFVTRQSDSRCRTYYNQIKVCRNDLEAGFTFGQSGMDQAVELLYKVQANTRYEECGFLGISCSMETDHMTLPDELDDGWDWIELKLDVLPNTLDGLWSWSALSNLDRDGDGLTDSQEIALGTAAGVWDSDGDGLSDGFEAGVQAAAGTDPTTYDTDGDGLSDGLEYRLGTTINDADSDDDGLSDGDEVFHWDGAQWIGGGWTLTIDGTDYHVFSSPLEDDADGDGLNDSSEKAAGSGPNGANEAPRLTLAAGPYRLSPTGAWSVNVAAGQALTSSLHLINSGGSSITETLSFCVPLGLGDVVVTASGDRTPPTQQNGSCYTWDFGSTPLFTFEQFQADLSATAGASTRVGQFAAALPYPVNGATQPISQTVPVVQDNEPPAVQLTAPGNDSILAGSYYVVGGYSQDDHSWVNHVELTVPAGTFTVTGTSPWAYTWDLPDDGIVDVSAVAYDVVGNASAAATVQVTVDSLSPVITSNLPDGATISADESFSTTFALSGTVSDNYAGLTRVQMRTNSRPWRSIWVTDTTPLATTWSGIWELPVVRTAQGEHTLYLRAYDAFGNVGYYSQTLFIDVIPPTNELTNRSYTQAAPPHVVAGVPLTLYGVANDAGNNPLPADPAALQGTLHSISDATAWLQPDTLSDDDAGVTVSWIGDFNGDRLGDLALGLPAAADGAGEVVVVRGRAGDWPVPSVGELEFLARNRPTFLGLPGAGLGATLQPAGDFNGDGFDDLLIGDPVNDRLFLAFGQSLDFGTDRVLDGEGGTRWLEILSQTGGESAGASFAGVGDVNDDGLSDVLVYTTAATGNKVYLLLGDASPLAPHFLDLMAGAVLDTGTAAAALGTTGDVDGDLVDDFAIAIAGTVYLFAGDGGWVQSGLSSLSTSQAIATFATSDSLPSIVAIGDVDGDGLDDFGYSNGDTPVVVFGDARHAFATHSLSGFSPALSGFFVAAGDVDKDGRSDLLAGNAAGDATLVLGSDLSGAAATIQGVATAASAPSVSGADLAGDGSSDLLVVPSASAAAGLGYDTTGGPGAAARATLVRPPFISGDWLPHAAVSAAAPTARRAAALLPGDVTVGTGGADYTSIQAAIDSGASRVLVEPGVYAEVITLTNDVLVAGSGADRTLLTFPGGVTGTVLVRAEGVNRATLMNLSLVGSGSDAGQTGLRVAGGAGPISLTRTIVRDMGTAIALDGATTDLDLKNNTLVGNGDGLLATNCASVDVRNTIFAYHTGTALAYQGCAAVQRHQYNLYWANGADMSPLDPGGGELFSAPLFEDYGANDFRVELVSPVIDAGAPGDPVPPGAGRAADIGHGEQTGSSYLADDDYCPTCGNDGLIWGVDAFDTVQEAVDAAQADLFTLSADSPVQFSVGVGAGTFTESVTISGSLQLLGSDADQTILQGTTGPAVTFQTTANAGVSGFTLTGGGADPVGVRLQNGSNTISVTRNLIKDNSIGIAVIERSSGSGYFNSIVSNTVGLQTGVFSTNITATTWYNWFDLQNAVVSHNDTGLLAQGDSAIFSDYNLLYNAVDYDNVLTGLNDVTGQDPLLTGAHAYLQAGSPALDAASPLAGVPTGGGVRADVGWHELLAAPISVLMGQGDDSIATENVGLARVEYAIVPAPAITTPITATLPATWTIATLDDPGARLTYWRTTHTPASDGLYRIYSRATDTLGNIETDVNDWYDGAFVVDSVSPVVTMTLVDHWEPYMQLVEAQVYDYAMDTFDISEIYFEIDGERVDGTWSLQEWTEDGVSPRTFHTFFRNAGAQATFSFQAFAVDGAGHLGASSLQTKTLAANVLSDDDFEAPRFLSLDVSSSVAYPYPYHDLVSGTVTFEGTAGDFYGSGGLVPSWINGYEVSMDGGASWEVIQSWDRDTGLGTVPNGNFRYRWPVEGGLDATTLPVWIRVTDNVGLSRITTTHVTVDTGPPQRFSPVTFSAEYGYHFDQRTPLTVTWQQPFDGSGQPQSVIMVGYTGGTGEPSFPIDGISTTVDVDEGGAWYAHVGAQDALENVSYEVFGPWYAGSVQDRDAPWSGGIQSLVSTIDGVLDITHNEWLTPTEWLDDDARPATGGAAYGTQSLYATWDGLMAFLGWRGGRWGPEGTMWAYYDVDLGGTGLAVTGALTLPFDADLAVSVESATLAHLWTFTGTTWISRSFDSLSWPWAAEFAHDPDRGGTELYFMFEECCRSTDAFDHYRMLAFAMDDAGSVWSAFPTHNALDGPFEYFYQWPILVDHYDLLKQPVSAQQPYVTMRFSSLPPSQKTLSSGETVTYVVELTNVEDKDAYDLTFQATASSGMTFQSLQGATCSPACTPGDTWWVELASLPGEATHAITFTAQLDGDLSGLAHVTATVQLTTTAGAIAHTLDLDPPAVTINRNPGGVVGTGWQAITGSADDALGAGVALVEVSQDGNSWQPATGTRFWSAALDVPAGTSWPLYARATDYHGLVSPVETVTFTIDTVAPLITPTVPAVITDSVVLIDGLARDPAPAGARVQSVAVQLDNQSAAWRSATLYAIDAGGQQSWRYVWAVPYESNVAHRLRFRATDYAGNVTVTGWYDVVVQTLPNQAPVADAGVDQSVNTNATVILDGSSSYDPDGHALAFRWTQTGGTLVTLSDAAAISPTFTAPVATGVLSFTLSVTDSLGLSDPTPDEVQVLVAEYRNYLPLVLNGASSPAQQ